MTTHVRKSEYTQLTAVIYKYRAAYPTDVKISLPVDLVHCHCFRIRFHFQKCSREIFMEHIHIHRHTQIHVRAGELIHFLSPTISSLSNASCSNIFLVCYFITNIKSCSTVTKNDIYTNIATGTVFTSPYGERSHTTKIKEERESVRARERVKRVKWTATRLISRN